MGYTSPLLYGNIYNMTIYLIIYTLLLFLLPTYNKEREMVEE